MTAPPLTPSAMIEVFEPAGSDPGPAAGEGSGRSRFAYNNGARRSRVDPVAAARAAWFGLIAFYRRRTAWLSLVVTSVAVCYVGGAAMFWFHSVALGEGGPAISWYAHWLLDSTIGFLALTPALFLIIPFATWAAVRLAGDRLDRRGWLYVAVAGVIFAVVTVPGPLAHDLFVARGTWLADKITALIGDPSRPLPPTHDYPLASVLTSQLGFGIPTYVLTTAAALVLVRWITGRRQRARQIEALAIALGRQARP